jgi:hypothetical protein
MKKSVMVLLALSFSFSGAWAQSMLKVRLADSSQFNVSVDGRYFNRRGTSITVGDLPPGEHRLKIFQTQLDRWGRGHEAVVFEGRVKTHEGMATLFGYDIDRDQVTETEQDMSAFPAPPPAHQNGQRFRDQNYDAGNYGNGGNGSNNGYSNNNYNNNGYGGSQQSSAPPAEPSTVTDAKMDDLKTATAAKATDIEKTNLLKDELKNDKISTAQIGVIMDWFIFESSKVDFAKWAYPITVDKNAFPDLENKFQYKASQDDLDQFLKSQQK